MLEEQPPEETIEDVFAAFREAWYAGERPDVEIFLETHPTLGIELRERIENFLMVACAFPAPESEEARGKTRVLGDFRVLHEIGRGGMGVVYEAEQISLGRRVALKILPSHLVFARDSVPKFHREAKAGSRQRHPGIVAVYGTGEHEGIHYIAQELVQGSHTLEDKLEALRKKGELPSGYFREAARHIAETADALHHAHEAGVIHRDVKPSNILITTEGRPKVTDFGLAKLEDAMALSRTGELAGTPYYMSPEQVTSRDGGIDRRTDIYSLGVTLYEMLTLRQPFEGSSSFEVLRKIPVADPADPCRVNVRIPRDLATVCLKAMEKTPEKRYQTMKELADDLRRFLSGEVVIARPVGSATRILKKIKRNPLISSAVTVAVLAVSVLMAWGVVYLVQMKRGYEEISRQSDLDLVYRLAVEAESLWPAYPGKIDEIKAWLDEAGRFLDRQTRYRLEIERLRSKGKLDAAEVELLSLLDKLVDASNTIGSEDIGLFSNVARRLHFAETVRAESIDNYREEWNAAISSIADREECPQYEGLVIGPILGFVPIGRDPDSTLWEFAHIQTGDVPVRNSDRKLVLSEDSGLVFVLIPGGTFKIGAVIPDKDKYKEGDPNVDPGARSFEGPIHAVTISDAFLLSKYEMTQGQWLRITGKNPSKFGPGTILDGKAVNLIHPVERVSWEDCSKVLSQLNLRLPSNAEWEYAARAGTDTVWWTGNDKQALEKVANLYDSCCLKVAGDIGTDYQETKPEVVDWLNDGYPIHAPVGSYLPNRFGLHDVIGNVYEWCQDNFVDSYEKTPTDGSAFESAGLNSRVYRSGGWASPVPVASRSAFRHAIDPGGRWWDLGVRPAYSLHRADNDG